MRTISSMRHSPPSAKLAFGVKSLAESLDLSELTVRRLIAARELPATKVGRRVLVRLDDVETFLRNKRT